MVTVDVKGNWQRWLKVRDLTKGVTYFFRVQARTIAYGPELQANVTAGPAEGEWAVLSPAWWAGVQEHSQTDILGPAASKCLGSFQNTL